MKQKSATPITDQVRDQQGDYLVAVESLERSHTTLWSALDVARGLLDDLKPVDPTAGATLDQWREVKRDIHAAMKQARALR